MRLLRIGAPGKERPALLDAEGRARDVRRDVDDYGPGFFASGGLDRLRSLLENEGFDRWPVIDPEERIGACIARPPKIVCVGLNYHDHAQESGMALPDEPVLFMKASNTISGPYDDVLIPVGATKTDWEVELGIVMGQQARYLPDPESALETVAGYTVSHDVSERAFQWERGGQWVKGKSCETFNPVGPWLVTANEVEDVGALGLWLSVNGETMQQGNTKDMVFGAGYLVWYISQFMVLEPGDLINTGTPAGVGMGMHPPRYLREGDEVALGIDGLGEQTQRLRQATA